MRRTVLQQRMRAGPPTAAAPTAAALAATALAFIPGCAVGPNYHRPAAETPPAWQPEAPWHQAEPGDAAVKGDWWTLFADTALDGLVERALAGNQNLKVAAARLDQARAEVTIARADLFPTIELSAGAARGRTSANRPLAAYAVPNQATVQNDFVIGPAVSYEVDLFGRVRREVEGAKATEQQAEADFENTRLVLLAQLVTDYFALRESDAEIAVVAHSLDLERDALGFITSRHDLGFATGLDLAQQQALVDAGATQFELLQNQRAEFEHAIATLVGAPAPGFAVPAVPAAATLPAVPIGVPSDLLQRRPDVASAERSMAAANARIGVARAAYFPTIGLGAGFSQPNAGWQSNALSSLFQASSRLWSVGLSATQTVFDAGRVRGEVRFADADYTAAVAGYRQTVLTAMEEVENGITGLASLGRAVKEANASVKSAQDAFDIATARYKGGVDTYLEMITAQQVLLGNQRTAVQVQGQQFATSVYLIKALGGGWPGSRSAPAATSSSTAPDRPRGR
ncbi:MAG TPA: efflux transporter outer membrane subunit [Steroidobacteraceae bacterium]|jgi:NodT family efflux transporter outer membrane factor (OMF) lipoprotein|nr:efflux transporter outer membrane subunit [Steroidobacteraceae bacterium]